MTTTKAFCAGVNEEPFLLSLLCFSPESETTSPALTVSFLLCFFCLLNSFDFVSFVWLFFNSKNNWKHNPRWILLCYFTSLVLSARFLTIFFFKMKIFMSYAVENQANSSGETPWLMRGFCLKQGKENLAGGRGAPLNIKSNLKNNSGLIRVFEIYRINYCLLVLLKTGIFFFSHDVLVEVTSYDEVTYCWVSATARDIAAILLETNTVKPCFKDNIFRKICMKRVFGFQQKGTLLFLFTRMAEVNSVENKQLYKTRISNKTVGYFRYLVL